MRSSTRDSVVSLKTFPDSLDANPHCQRHFLQSNPRSLINDYVEGKFGLHVYLRARNKVADLKCSQFVIVFDKVLAGVPEVNGFDGHTLGNPNIQDPIDDGCADQMELPVPVDSRPMIENLKGLSQVKFVTLKSAGYTRVRLYSLDESPQILRDDLLHTPDGLFEFSGVGTEDKFPLFLIGRRVLSELQNGSIVNTGIESGSELVKHLTKLEREWQEPMSLDGLDTELPFPVVVYLSTRFVHLTCIQAVPYFCEGLAVKFRPVNAIPTRLEW
jgi:hypothetical protein